MAPASRCIGSELRGFLRRHIQLPGLAWHQVSLEPTRDPALKPFIESLDVIGDGSLVLLPTPGHTAGSVSLLIRCTGRPSLLLVGDLTYGANILQRGQTRQRPAVEPAPTPGPRLSLPTGRLPRPNYGPGKASAQRPPSPPKRPGASWPESRPARGLPASCSGPPLSLTPPTPR